jgi:hypothetical protein
MTDETQVELDKVVEVKVEEKKPKEKLSDKPVISKELFTEINLFIPQVVAFVFCVLFGLIIIVVTRLMSIGFVENVRQNVSVQIYEQLAASINFFNTLTTLGVALPIVIFGLFLGIKYFMLMPRKDRNIVMRIYNARAILFSLEKLKPKMLFNPADKRSEVIVDNPSKHYDYLNGRPVVMLRQEDRTNVSVLGEDVDTSGKGRDTDSMVANALHTGYEIAREQMSQREDKSKIIMIMLIIVLAGIAFIGWNVIQNPQATANLVVTALGGAVAK